MLWSLRKCLTWRGVRDEFGLGLPDNFDITLDRDELKELKEPKELKGRRELKELKEQRELMGLRG